MGCALTRPCSPSSSRANELRGRGRCQKGGMHLVFSQEDKESAVAAAEGRCIGTIAMSKH